MTDTDGSGRSRRGRPPGESWMWCKGRSSLLLLLGKWSEEEGIVKMELHCQMEGGEG